MRIALEPSSFRAVTPAKAGVECLFAHRKVAGPRPSPGRRCSLANLARIAMHGRWHIVCFLNFRTVRPMSENLLTERCSPMSLIRSQHVAALIQAALAGNEA